MNSLINNLEIEFEQLQNKLWEFLSCLETVSINRNIDMGGISVYAIGRPDYRWGKLTIHQEREQIELSKSYNSFIEYLDGLVSITPISATQKRYEKIKKEFEIWLYLDRNFALTDSIEKNKKNYLDTVNEMRSILELYNKQEDSFIIVPDTNALFIEPDPAKYIDIVNLKKFIFLLLPTVVSELDKKAKDEEKEIGKKAKGLIKRIKGWRAQGKITEGITINKTITLKAEIENPSFENMPDFLDKSHNDDKIIMNILNIQRRFPSSVVVLVTKDINMQNKAEYAMVNCIDIEFKKEQP